MEASPLLPVTLITGENSAAIERTVKRVRSALGGRRVAIMGPEVPDVGWDLRVIIDPQIIWRTPGCVCCALRGDLISVLTAFAVGRRRPDWVVVVETPGSDSLLAVQTFLSDPSLRRMVTLDGVVSSIDGPAGSVRLASACGVAEETDPIRLSSPWTSTLILERSERLTTSGRAGLTRAVRGTSPLAQIESSDSPLTSLTGRGILDPLRVPEHLSRVRTPGAVVIEITEPLDRGRTESALNELVENHTEQLSLFLASLTLRGEERKHVIQAARSSVASGWIPTSCHDVSRFLAIGEGIDSEALGAKLGALTR